MFTKARRRLWWRFCRWAQRRLGFALATRLLVSAFPTISEQWHFVLTALAILSMVLGNVVALAQTSMKRMLAYSSIAQAGFVLIGLGDWHRGGLFEHVALPDDLPIHELWRLCLRHSV